MIPNGEVLRSPTSCLPVNDIGSRSFHEIEGALETFKLGSGRMEKRVARAIGYRQKKKGMSWSEKGSKALGILRVVELNGQWEELWFGGAAA